MCLIMFLYMAYYIFLHAAILSVKFYYILLIECHLHSFVYSLLNLSVHSLLQYLWMALTSISLCGSLGKFFVRMPQTFLCVQSSLLLHSVVWQPCTFLCLASTLLCVEADYIPISDSLLHFFVWPVTYILLCVAADFDSLWHFSV